jgi:prevent-host-death family protein
MKQTINLREVNQNLSKFISSLHEGDEIVITKRGKAVAKLVSIIEKKELSSIQYKGLQRILSLKQKSYHLGAEGVNRDELHER